MKELISSKIISDILQEQYEYCITLFNEKNILGIFIYGNVNYNMGYDERDIHSELIYIPTFEELCMSHNHTPEYLRYKDHVIRVLDARNIYHAIYQGRLELAEAIYTDYYIVNPRYSYIFENFFKPHRDVITDHNKVMRLNQAAAIGLKALDKYSRTLEPYQIYKAARALYFCNMYSAGMDFKTCITLPEKDREYYYNLRFKGLTSDREDTIKSFGKRLKRYADIPNEGIEELPEKPAQELRTAIMSIMTKSMDKGNTKGFLAALTAGEKKALQAIFDAVHLDGEVTMSKLTESAKISRQCFSSLFNKMKANQIATVENRGVRGTKITFSDEEIIDIFYKGDY